MQKVFLYIWTSFRPIRFFCVAFFSAQGGAVLPSHHITALMEGCLVQWRISTTAKSSYFERHLLGCIFFVQSSSYLVHIHQMKLNKFTSVTKVASTLSEDIHLLPFPIPSPPLPISLIRAAQLSSPSEKASASQRLPSLRSSPSSPSSLPACSRPRPPPLPAFWPPRPSSLPRSPP